MSVIIREAVPKDAAELVKFVTTLLEGSESFLEMAKGEFTLTVGEEEKFIQDCRKSENSIFIVAEKSGEIIGSLICVGSERIRIKHNTVLGMSVMEKYRNQGIGSQLLEYVITWAKKTKIVKRIELHVFKTNVRAIHLYRKYGFKIEGEKQNALKVNDKYINEYIMALSI